MRGAEAAAPDMMLAGDSHAGALAQGFFEAAATAGRAGYQYSSNGFRPLPGLEQRGDPQWGRQSDAFTAFLRDHPGIRTVYLAVYWQHQVSGSTYRHSGDVWTDADYDGSGTAYNPVAMANGLARLAGMFPDRQFVLLDDVPTGHMQDLRTAVRAIRFGHVDDWSRTGIGAGEESAQRALYEPVLTAVAAAHANVTYQPVFAGLCGERTCPLFDGTTPLYRDGDHLGPAGSLRMAPVLLELLFRKADAAAP
ncbi:SGNH hydrolase domain-containing protein [Mangrovicoccus ximenensis]|uniref:SGNH hydrolase domain-containing protein n=1 Tax=Mangrovicoccus ximenensis TaxID=1911570 RepID=UPI001374C6F8|nr:SGNH hydrolase domain-containing protein [Mangrovicoccus ximenensis]